LKIPTRYENVDASLYVATHAPTPICSRSLTASIAKWKISREHVPNATQVHTPILRLGNC